MLKTFSADQAKCCLSFDIQWICIKIINALAMNWTELDHRKSVSVVADIWLLTQFLA